MCPDLSGSRSGVSRRLAGQAPGSQPCAREGHTAGGFPESDRLTCRQREDGSKEQDGCKGTGHEADDAQAKLAGELREAAQGNLVACRLRGPSVAPPINHALQGRGLEWP